jgi:hypothetical protein
MAVVPVPDLRCVLRHWYELRPENKKIDSVNNRRFAQITQLSMRVRRQGLDMLRKDAQLAAKSMQVGDPALLIISSALLAGDVAVEGYVHRQFKARDQEWRVAATYAALFFLWRSEEVTCTLTERAILGGDAPLVVLAARDVMDIHSSMIGSGRCPRCRNERLSKETHDWVPTRVQE